MDRNMTWNMFNVHRNIFSQTYRSSDLWSYDTAYSLDNEK